MSYTFLFDQLDWYWYDNILEYHHSEIFLRNNFDSSRQIFHYSSIAGSFTDAFSLWFSSYFSFILGDYLLSDVISDILFVLMMSRTLGNSSLRTCVSGNYVASTVCHLLFYRTRSPNASYQIGLIFFIIQPWWFSEYFEARMFPVLPWLWIPLILLRMPASNNQYFLFSFL